MRHLRSNTVASKVSYASMQDLLVGCVPCDFIAADIELQAPNLTLGLRPLFPSAKYPWAAGRCLLLTALCLLLVVDDAAAIASQTTAAFAVSPSGDITTSHVDEQMAIVVATLARLIVVENLVFCSAL